MKKTKLKTRADRARWLMSLAREAVTPLTDENCRTLIAEIWKIKPMLREIKIEPVLNGWIVLCGCQRVVFTDKQTMLRELGKYYADPCGTERRYLEKRTNKTEHLPGQPPMAMTLAAAEPAPARPR